MVLKFYQSTHQDSVVTESLIGIYLTTGTGLVTEALIRTMLAGEVPSGTILFPLE